MKSSFTGKEISSRKLRLLTLNHSHTMCSVQPLAKIVLIILTIWLICSGALARAKRVRGAPWVRKFGKFIHPRKFGYEVAYARTLFAGEGRESDVSPSGEEYVINRAMHLCNPLFSWREIAQEIAWPKSSHSKPVYFRNLFSSILSIRICDRGAQFIVNCFEKIVMATNDSGFFSTYLLVNEERPERERREGREQELTGELAKRIQVKNLCGI